MTLLDGLLLALLVLAAVRGAARGAVAEILGPLSVVFALLFAAYAAPQFSTWVQSSLALEDAPSVVAGAGFAVAFVIAFGALWLLGLVAGRMWRRGAVGVLHRALGAVVGGAKFAVLLAIAILYSQAIPASTAWVRMTQESVVATTLSDYAKVPWRISTRGDATHED